MPKLNQNQSFLSHQPSDNLLEQQFLSCSIHVRIAVFLKVSQIASKAALTLADDYFPVKYPSKALLIKIEISN